jgi:transposase
MGRHSKYPEEFRHESVQLVLTTDRSMADVARDLDINYKTLGNWVRSEQTKTARDQASGALSESERVELNRLKKEHAELKVEREILRKVAAWLAQETPLGPRRVLAPKPQGRSPDRFRPGHRW